MQQQLMAALEGRAVYINGVGVIGLVMIFVIVSILIGLLLFRNEILRRA